MTTIPTTRPLLRPVTKRLLRTQLIVAGTFWAIMTLLAVGAIIVARVTSNEPGSGFQYSLSAVMWFVFATSIVTGGGYLRPYVANGVSRHVFVRANLIAIAIISLLHAVVMAAAFAIERAVFDAASWPHDVSTTTNLEWWQLPFTTLLYSCAGGLSGLLVAIVYVRVGGWRGTLLLPLTLLPVLLVLGGQILLEQLDVTAYALLGTQAVVTALAVVAGTVAVYRVARRMPIKPATA